MKAPRSLYIYIYTSILSPVVAAAAFLAAPSAHAFNNSICEPDSNRVCLGVITKGGSQALLKCLRENETRLSPACKAAISKEKPDSQASLGR